MASDFPRIISLLRKERNISQKKAADDLGISQGLLSHYEKGKRECGLDFVVKAADYYNVSCDYLLGRSPEPQGKTISVESIPEVSAEDREKATPLGIVSAFSKKRIINSINVLFSIFQKTGSQTLIREASGYLMLAVYNLFRAVYSANPKNDQNFFKIEKALFPHISNAAMSVAYAKAEAAAKGISVDGGDCAKDPESSAMTTATLAEEYPQSYSSVVNLIKNCEARANNVMPADSETRSAAGKSSEI